MLGRLPRPGRRTAVGAVVAAVAAGCFLRFFTSSHLWLDEALTVEIARRPLGALFVALRHDGAPPLYYLLLHLWIGVFGDGDIAVRAVSGIVSVATLPLAWLAGRRVAGAAMRLGHVPEAAVGRSGLAALLLFATSPYAIRYGSEARMYSLVVLLVLAFGLAIVRALEHPGVRTWAPVTLLTAAMAYTHYWTFLLLGTVAVSLLVQARRRPAYRGPARAAVVAMLAAGVLFAPWLPTFVFQMVHTGTPWAPKVHAQVLLDTVFDWAGPASTGALLGLVLLFTALIGFSARPSGPGERHLHVDPTGRVPGRYLAALWLVPLALAYLLYLSGGSAYAERYTGISLPAFLLLAALGIGLLGPRKLTVGLLAVSAVTGLLGGWTLARMERSQAGQIAGKIAAQARPGDVVAYCPDQLGPAVHRALVRQHLTGVKEVALADPSGPALVDWVDYAARMQRASSADFARQVDRLAGPYNAIYFVRADGYRLLETTCGAASDQLASVRERTFQLARRQLLEGATLERFSTIR